MPQFIYEAYSSDGKHQTGEIVASNDAAALDTIVERGLTPISLQESRATGPWWATEISLAGADNGLKRAELKQFFTTLASLLSAHLSLTKSLAFCENHAKHSRTKQVIANIRSNIAAGSTLAAAMRAEKAGIPERYLTMIELGEISNTLSEVMEKLVTLITTETKSKQQLQSALIYPCILMAMSALVLALVVFYLVPTLIPVFSGAGAKAPPVIRFLGAFREIVLTSWPLIIIGIFVVGVGLSFALRFLSTQLNAMKRRLPLVGPFIIQRETQIIARMLATLLESGCTLSAALKATQSTTTQNAYDVLLGNAITHIEAGGSLANILSDSPLIDAMAKPLIQAGEESDSLSHMMALVATTLEVQITTTLERAIGIVTPALTLLIGLGIGAVILSIISAILDLNDIAF